MGLIHHLFLLFDKSFKWFCMCLFRERWFVICVSCFSFVAVKLSFDSPFYFDQVQRFVVARTIVVGVGFSNPSGFYEAVFPDLCEL